MASDVDDEAAMYRAEHRRLAARIAEQPGRNPHDEWVLAVTGLPEAPITEPTDADYVVPPHIEKTAPPEAVRQLRAVLADLREFRRGIVGLGLIEVAVLYNGDEVALVLRDTFTEWCLDHLRRRLARPSPKDRGDPVRTFFRLTDEITTWVDSVADVPASGHAVALSGVSDRVAHAIFEATWGPRVQLIRSGADLRVTYERLDTMWYRPIQSIMTLYGWHEADQVRRRIAAGTATVAAGVSGDTAALRAELAVIAADLTEVKGLLVRGYRPQDYIVPIPGGVATWNWDVRHHAGIVATAVDEATLREEIETSRYSGAAVIGLDGRPAEIALPWLDLGDGALAWAVGVLRPVHRRLVAAWVDAARPEVPAEEPTDPVAQGELVAAACEALAHADDAATAADDEPTAGRARVPAVRTITLLAMLERRFGCEVAQGKGSEITVYRPGGRKFTLGHHARNRHVPAHVVRGLLKAVGIGTAEWAAAARRSS